VTDVSVLVPSYNHSRFVEATLRSIFAQTLRPKKLIVIDDGSKDESGAEIERVLKDCPFECEFIARENKGLSATLNEGFALLDGGYFAYLGSDDIWLPTFLEEQTKLLDSRPDAALAFCHAFVVDDEDNIIDRTDNWTAFADGDLLPTLLRGEIFSSPGVVYRRSILPERPWNEDSRLEDYELYLNLACGSEFARNADVLCAWRQHSSNTSDNFPLMLCEQIAAQDRAIDKLKVSRAELDRIQRELRFRSVANCVRSGHKAEGWKLFRENFAGAALSIDVVREAVRLAVPQYLFNRNRMRKRHNSISKYGKLKL
jgi:alpha-1,3-rhamnosyltransferase